MVVHQNHSYVLATPHAKSVSRLASARGGDEDAARTELLRLWRSNVDFHVQLSKAAGRVAAVYGACTSDLDLVAVVTEPLVSLIDLAMTPLYWHDVLLIFESAFEWVGWLQRGVQQDGDTAVPHLYGDVHAQQFGLSASGVVKLLDVERKDFHRYRAVAYGRSAACSTANDCLVTFVRQRFLFGQLLVALRADAAVRHTEGAGTDDAPPPQVRHANDTSTQHLPTDFACIEHDGVCAGLDAGTMTLAMCRMVALPLLDVMHVVPFGDSDADTERDTLQKVHRVLAACSGRKRAKRASYADTASSLARLRRHYVRVAGVPEHEAEPDGTWRRWVARFGGGEHLYRALAERNEMKRRLDRWRHRPTDVVGETT